MSSSAEALRYPKTGNKDCLGLTYCERTKSSTSSRQNWRTTLWALSSPLPVGIRLDSLYFKYIQFMEIYKNKICREQFSCQSPKDLPW